MDTTPTLTWYTTGASNMMFARAEGCTYGIAVQDTIYCNCCNAMLETVMSKHCTSFQEAIDTCNAHYNSL
jgi:hypothetical protein